MAAGVARGMGGAAGVAGGRAGGAPAPGADPAAVADVVRRAMAALEAAEARAAAADVRAGAADARAARAARELDQATAALNEQRGLYARAVDGARADLARIRGEQTRDMVIGGIAGAAVGGVGVGAAVAAGAVLGPVGIVAVVVVGGALGAGAGYLYNQNNVNQAAGALARLVPA